MNGAVDRVLIANRGEIALRVIQGVRAAGATAIAVYSEADRNAPFVRAADLAVEIGPAPPLESYLEQDKIVAAAKRTGANAVHPGYGFLSENATFAERLESEGIVFVGPTADSIRVMGDKMAAVVAAKSAEVPTVPSFTPKGSVDSETLRREAESIGAPLLVKAAAGGGGKGMRVARNLDELDELVAAAGREAANAFGDDRVFLEKYLENARHVEVQVFGDGEGDGIAIGERDCSVQRRHQKIIEESPAPDLPDATRKAMHDAAVALVQSTKYRGAGTVEFILASTGEFYFLEMNTRLQVEHPVTELVFGLDLVDLQLRIARGEGIPNFVRDATTRGHAIEVRVYAESAPEFLPSIGQLEEVVWPSGSGVRVDAGVERGGEVSLHYDPMLAKIIVHAADRSAAIERMRQAIEETFIVGVETTLGFCRDVLGSESFRRGEVHTTMIADQFSDWSAPEPDSWIRVAQALAPKLDRGGTSTTREEPGVWSSLDGWRMT